MERSPLKHGDVYPVHVLRDEYGMNAANRPVIMVDASQVPESLRDIIPLVERWAIPCDVTRGDYFAHQSEQDIASFWYAVLPRVDAINEWLDSIRASPTASAHFLTFFEGAQRSTAVDRG